MKRLLEILRKSGSEPSHGCYSIVSREDDVTDNNLDTTFDAKCSASSKNILPSSSKNILSSSPKNILSNISNNDILPTDHSIRHDVI